MEKLIFHNVSKSFISNIFVLHSFNFRIERGDFAVIYGPSAVGKSTILNLIAGLDRPDSGLVEWQENDISHRIGYLFQNYESTLFPWLTNNRNIEMPLLFDPSKKSSKTERKKIIQELIEETQLDIPLKAHPFEMSGGGKQKVALARALISKPDILLLDEPFNSLDINDRDFMRQKIVEIWQKLKITVVFVTHDIDEALLVGNKLIVLGGRPAHLMSEPISVDLPYPRDINVKTSEQFFHFRNEVLKLFEKAKNELISGMQDESRQ